MIDNKNCISLVSPAFTVVAKSFRLSVDFSIFFLILCHNTELGDCFICILFILGQKL